MIERGSREEAIVTRPLSSDLRERIIRTYEDGLLPQWLVAEQFQIGEATMRRLVALKRETGGVEPRPRTHGPPSTVTPKQLRVLKRILDRHPDYTYQELTDRWNHALGLSRHRSTTVRAVGKLGYTLKKKASSRRNG